MVVDYRQLNANTVDEQYPVPRLEDALDRMAGARYFSTLDLKAGYHQIRVRPEDQEKTAFSFERGHYHFARMPFGLKNAPRTFQRVMDEFLRGIGEDVCQIYVDDIVIFSKTASDHKRHLEKVLTRAREFGIKLSSEKSVLARNEVAFLGHIISAEGVKPDPEKVRAIMDMKMPRTQKGVRSLLGVLNFYRRFIPEMARKTTILTNMLRKGAKVQWTQEAERGVQECIQQLTREPILAYPDFTKTFTITSDASAYAVGAVLSQPGKQGDQPIAYVSRRLTPAEERYSTIERELLGIVWAVESFRPYVYGRQFVIVTDHKPLQWVGTLKESTARVGRWKERLMPYNYVIRHAPGRANVVADWLSRAIETCAVEEGNEQGPSLREYFQEWNPEEAGEENEDMDRSREEGAGMEEVDEAVNGKRRQIRWTSKAEGLDRVAHSMEGRRKVLRVETTAGVTMERIVRILKDVLRPGHVYHLYVGNEVIWRRLNELYKRREIGGGCTIIRCAWLAQTILDAERQEEIAQGYHVGKTNHRGAAELVAALRRRYYWDGMQRTAEEVVAKCEVCGRVKAATRPPQALQQVTPTATGPLQHLEMDVFTWQGRSWVTLLDPFSKLLRVKKVKGRKVEAVVKAIRQWSSIYGTPETVTSDGGTEFRNRQVQEEARRLEVRWHYTTPGHTQGRGNIERAHGTISDHLRVIGLEQEVDADTAMTRAVTGYNHSVHSTTGYAPMEIVFGKALRLRDPRMTAPEGDRTEAIQAHRLSVHKIWEKARERLCEEKARRVLRHNVRTTDGTERVQLGTVVYRRIPSNRRKEPERYTGPYRVTGVLEHGRYELENVQRPGSRQIVHIQQLKIPGKVE